MPTTRAQPRKTVTQERDELRKQLDNIVDSLRDYVSNGYVEVSDVEQLLEDTGIEYVRVWDLKITVPEFQHKKNLEDGSTYYGSSDNKKAVQAIADAVEKALTPLSDCGTVGEVEVEAEIIS